MQPWEHTANAVKTVMEAMMIPERSAATEDRDYRRYMGETPCVRCGEPLNEDNIDHEGGERFCRLCGENVEGW